MRFGAAFAIAGALAVSASCKKSEDGTAGSAGAGGSGGAARRALDATGGFSADLAKELGGAKPGSDGKAATAEGAKPAAGAPARAAANPPEAARSGSDAPAGRPGARPAGEATTPGKPEAARSGSGAPAVGPPAGTKGGEPANGSEPARAGSAAALASAPAAGAGRPAPAAPPQPAPPSSPRPASGAPGPRGPVPVPPDLAAIKLSLLPNWDRDVDEPGTFQYVVRIKGTQSTKTFTFHYGYDDPKAPTDRERYKKYLQDTRALTGDLRDRQRGAAWFLEGNDASGLPAFRYVVLYGGKHLICYGSLYKDADGNRLGDDRDQTVIQAKQICETLAL
ncbi:MAG TPA: hypothetical protein VFK02_28580 [Kofleriaceae bacterium]|nr:hypothetical protein [Kofleriaceae bacterium]